MNSIPFSFLCFLFLAGFLLFTAGFYIGYAVCMKLDEENQDE